ncbi:transcriptional regulator [Bradyrhizobium genosp. P]|uniref:transcriptional regulator n=1 Tax=Bradyrhizobium genosp. P TaxID=83641 RepID=UPI003CF31F4D
MNENAPEWLDAYAIARDEIWENDPHFKGFLAALQELNKETDRGVALVATSFLDKLLMDTLAAFLIENASAKALLSGFNAPFGSFSTRIAGCLAMGLITDHEAQQCETLRKVRNRFAHEVEMNFNTDSVKALCNNLLVPERDKDGDARRKFMSGAMMVLIALLNRPHEVGKCRLTRGGWKSSLASVVKG